MTNIKRIFLIVLLQIILMTVFAQDTIFSDAYPKGLVINIPAASIPSNKNIKIDKGEYTIMIDKDEIIKITNGSGVVFQNTTYLRSLNIVVPVDPSSGNITYNEVVEVAGIKKKELYEGLKVLPNNSVTYILVSKDNIEF